jgi:Peptidase family S41
MARLEVNRWGAIVGLLAGLVSAAAVAGPRDDVGEIAVLIRDYYFDAQRAEKVVAELKRDANAGAFDRLSDANDLAFELTRRLKKVDGHFNVIWEAPPEASGPAADSASSTAGGGAGMQPVPPEAFETLDRRANFGFRRVERLPGNIGYIDLATVANIDFTQADSPARRAADAALALVRGADAIILDVRENGGGAPSMVGYLVSAFVEPGRDVFNVFHSRSGTQSERPAVAYPEPMLSVPVYVLTSARTASAAEAIAFTLQTCGRAKVVGENSAGAANPGMMFRTPHGFAVFVSTGAPRNPINGRSWEGEGVQPDTEAPAARALTRAQVLALEGFLSGPIAGFERVDAQWALDALRANAHSYKAGGLSRYTGSYGPYEIKLVSGALESKRGQQPALKLVPLQKDLFYPEGDPSRRYVFIRRKEDIVALEVRRSRGDGQHLNRSH